MNFKNKISFEKILLEAGNRRLNDLDFFEEEIDDEMAMRIVANESLYTDIKIQSPNDIIQSGKETESIKNLKLLNNILNGKLLNLNNFNKFYSENIYSEMLQIEHKAEALSSRIDESEIAILEKSEKVHSNDFIKNKDMGDGSYGSVFNKDFKTGLSFASNEMCEVMKGVGATLPVEAVAHIRPERAYIVHEGTDSGDSKQALSVSDIGNIFKKNKIFNYVVVRKEKENKLYKRKTSYSEFPYSRISNFSFGIEFSSTVYFNNIRISSCSSIGYEIKEIKALIGKNKWVSLEFEKIDVFGNINLFFPPVNSKNLQIVLEQNNVVGRTEKGIAKSEEFSINKTLNSLGFVSNIGMIEEKDGGYYQDFSIRDVEVSLIKYGRRGAFTSKPIEVQGFYSCDLRNNTLYSVDSTLEIRGDYDEISFETQNFRALSEFYLCLDLKESDGSPYQEIVPLLDRKENQKELLVGSNERSKVKLFPDLRANNLKKKIKSINFISNTEEDEMRNQRDKNLFIRYNSTSRSYEEVESYTKRDEYLFSFDKDSHLWEGVYPYTNNEVLYLKFEFESDHSLDKADYIDLISSDKRLSGRTKVLKVLNDKEVIISCYNIGISSEEYIQEHLIDTFLDNNYYAIKRTEDPFKVFQDRRLLKIGDDYMISLDGGSNFFNYFPLDSSYDFIFNEGTAGEFCIKFKDLDTSSYYLIEYTHLYNQYLSRNKKIRLVNNNFSIDEELKKYKGEIRTMIIMRSESPEAYNTPIVLDYDLIIYENETKVETERTNRVVENRFDIRKKRNNRNGS